MTETLELILRWCGYITGISAAVAVIVKVMAEVRKIKKGHMCILRSSMLHTYYRHRENNQIRQYEYENFLMEYQAYKALGGNSFIEDICREVRTWEVIT